MLVPSSSSSSLPFPLSSGCLNFYGNTFAEWSSSCEKWLAASYDVERIGKCSIGTDIAKAKPIPVDHHYSLILSAQRSLCSLSSPSPPPSARLKLSRKCRLLGFDPCSNLAECARLLDTRLKHHVQDKAAKALSLWKQKVRTWIVSSKEIHLFLKNPLPAKPHAVLDTCGNTVVDPIAMANLLNAYWGALESWPTPGAAEQAEFLLEDKYSVFLPRVCQHIELTVEDLVYQKKTMRDSAAGLDGWTVAELKALPREAFVDLLRIWPQVLSGFASSPLSLYKRVPLEKGDHDTPCPQHLRPIDVFPVVTRLLTSAWARKASIWARQVVHPSQNATFGGVLCASSRLCMQVETSLHASTPRWAVAVDFAKLFNTIAISSVAQAARFMGLSEQAILELATPISTSKGAWRLPLNAVAPFVSRQRGLPQGLASSVLSSELFLSVFLWRLHKIWHLCAICYVDDLNLIAQDGQTLRGILRELFGFASDFSLQIAPDKCCVWGTNVKELQEIGKEWGIPYKSSFVTLGTEWATSRSAKPAYVKEAMRMEEALRRLARLQHLPTTLILKAQATSVGILSLTDFSPPPCGLSYKSLRSAIKKTLGCLHASPEIVLNILLDTSLDPHVRWKLAYIRLLSDIISLPEGRSLVDTIKRPAKHSRVGTALRILRDMHWKLEDGIVVSPMRINLRLPWATIRRTVMTGLKRFECSLLEKRRSPLYAGIGDLQPKPHRRLLAQLRPFDAAILLRIWGGSVLTRAHRHTVDPTVEPSCMCGFHSQTLDHLLYHCPLVDPPDPPIRAWAARVPGESIALLCPPTADSSIVRIWKRVCLRAIRVVSGVPSPPQETDWNGHEIHHDATATFIFCIRCHVMRKIADSKFLPIRACAGEYMGGVATEGDYIVCQKHVLRLILVPWRRTALRLKWCCQKCPFSVWPHLFPPTRPCAD